MTRELILKLIRFGVVGLTVMVTFTALNWLFGHWMPASVAFLVAYPPALLLHYLLNKRWTFRHAQATRSTQVAEYLYTVLVTFLIQWPVFLLASKVFGWKAWVAAGVANLAQMSVSFLMLQVRVFRHAPPQEHDAREAWHRLAGVATGLLIAAFLFWTVMGRWAPQPIGEKQRDYYNLLIDGFRKGSLAVDIEPTAALKAAKDPYRPEQRPLGTAPADISYFNGKFYLYFGVVPVLVLFWPFRLLAHCDLPMNYAVLTFLVGATWLAGALWWRFLKDHFPRTSLLTKLAGFLLLAVAGGQLAVARRANLWETPIAAGYFFLMATSAAAYAALRAPRPAKWLALAGLMLGCAIGSRPTLVVAGGGLAVVMLAIALRGSDAAHARFDGRKFAGALLAAAIPLGLIVGGLLAYNHARFHNPFEFGLNYQLTSSYEPAAEHFRLKFVPFNTWLYFWSVPQWGPYFPFFHPPDVPPRPSGYYGYEYVHGALWTLPVLWFAIVGFVATYRTRGNTRTMLCYFLASAVASSAVLLAFNTAAARYTADFLPWWLWVAAIGVAWLETEWTTSRAWRRALQAVFVVATLFSVGTAFCASAELHGIWKFLDPAGYARVGRFADLPASWWEKLAQPARGAVEMEVVFPENPSGSYEPLLVAGVSYESSYVFVFYHSARRIQLGSAVAGVTPLLSEPFEVVPGRRYRMRIETGALYPPAEHPLFASWFPREVAAVKEWTHIALNGRTVLSRRQPSIETSPGRLIVGRDEGAGTFGRRFTGTIVSWHRTGLPTPSTDVNQGGDVELSVTLPDDSESTRQPLVVLGRTGDARVLGMRLIDSTHMAFSYEVWGQGMAESGPIAIPADRTARLRIRLGNLLRVDSSAPNRIMRNAVGVWVNGQLAWWCAGVPLDTTQAPLEIGENTIGSSAVSATFLGRVESARRLGRPQEWKSGPFAAVRFLIGGRGANVEPLVATGVAGRANTLGIEWLPRGRARFVYDHWGVGATESHPFEWPEETAHRVEVVLPSLSTLDEAGAGRSREGELRVKVDGKDVWAARVSYYVAESASVVVGRNVAGSSATGPVLNAVVLDVSQTPVITNKTTPSSLP